MPPIDRRSPEFAALVALTMFAVVPLWVGRFLPLLDYPAHLIVPAAMLHASDPAMRIDELYLSRLGLNPNSLHYLVTFLLGQGVGIEAASKVFLSLAVAALPWSVLYALRVFGRDWRLSLLSMPLMLGKGFFYGFVGHCAALPLSIALVAAVAQEARRPSLRRKAFMALASALLPFAHFFTMLITVVVGLAVGWRERGSWKTALPLSVGPLLMIPWFVNALMHPSARPVMQPLPFAEWAGPRDLLAMVSHWFLDVYAGHFDEALAVGLVAAVAAFHGFKSLSKEAGVLSATPLLAALGLSAGYLVFPFELRRPFEWWAMNVRFIPLAFLWLVVAAPVAEVSRRGRLVLAGVAAAALAFFVFVASDFRRFNDEEAGLSKVLRSLPRGSIVLGLSSHFGAPMYYMHDEYYYLSSYAVVEAGGMAAPFTTIPQAWRDPKQVPPHPPGGDSALFDFSRHAKGFTHFLVRHQAGPGHARDPLEHDSRVERVAQAAPWALYRCLLGCGPD